MTGCSGHDRAWRSSECGAGTVLMLAVAMVVVTALMASAALATGYTARRQAAAAADLAALAGAGRLQTGAVAPCEAASDVASANGGELADCVIDGSEVEVQVQVPVKGSFGWLPDQLRRARAGPPG